MEKVHVIGFGSDFIGMTLKAQATKEKIDKLNFIKIKNFCASRILSTTTTKKDTINRIKR